MHRILTVNIIRIQGYGTMKNNLDTDIENFASKRRIQMKRSMIFCVIAIFVLFARIYPEVVTVFPDLVKPTELRIDDNYIYIVDQYSILVYDLTTFKPVKTLGQKGEGPQEFKIRPEIFITDNKLVLYDKYKILIYSKGFKLIRESNLLSYTDQIYPIEDHFILTTHQKIDNKEYRVFSLVNSNFEKLKDLAKYELDQDFSKYFINPWPRCYTWKNKAFITQPRNDLYFDVFGKDGEKLYQIEKDVDKVKSGEKHRRMYMDEMLYFLGRSIFERGKARGVYDKPVKEFLPVINRFWMLDDRIYVKTYDITDTTEKFYVLDLEGNIKKAVFLPKTYREILTFHKDKFYYLMESEEDETWTLYAVPLAL
jgi:hypothetical protein